MVSIWCFPRHGHLITRTDVIRCQCCQATSVKMLKKEAKVSKFNVISVLQPLCITQTIIITLCLCSYYATISPGSADSTKRCLSHVIQIDKQQKESHHTRGRIGICGRWRQNLYSILGKTLDLQLKYMFQLAMTHTQLMTIYVQ